MNHSPEILRNFFPDSTKNRRAVSDTRHNSFASPPASLPRTSLETPPPVQTRPSPPPPPPPPAPHPHPTPRIPPSTLPYSPNPRFLADYAASKSASSIPEPPHPRRSLCHPPTHPRDSN